MSSRLEKYQNRGLANYPLAHTRSRHGFPVKDPSPQSWLQLRDSVLDMSATGHWVLLFEHNFLAGINFCFAPMPPVQEMKDLNKRDCLPWLFYPCGNQHALADLAYVRGHTHWLVRSLAGTSSLIAIPGAGRVWSNLVKPSWLMRHLDLSCEALVSLAEQQLPKVLHVPTLVQPELTRYVIPCKVPMQGMLMFQDWVAPSVCEDGEPKYNPKWMVVMDMNGETSIPATMFCSEHLDQLADVSFPCACSHALERPFPLF